jgi:putative two-component system hydrogenase maturation factor HypX/HoxX
MRILFLTHSFNSLTQRLFVELEARGHELSVEFDIADSVAEEAVALFRPDLVVAPYLRRAIPESIWRRHVCLVVHPGIVGDRGPSALDWAIMSDEREWGVTVLQANAEMDAGDIWASEIFPMRSAKKSSLYRNEVTEATTRAVLAAVERFASGTFRPRPLDYSAPDVRGRLRPLMKQTDRAIDWQRDDTATVLRKVRAADGFPGVLDSLFGVPCRLYDAHDETSLRGDAPGEVIAKRDGALLRTTRDGAIWIGHVMRTDTPAGGDSAFKLPATVAFAAEAAAVPESPLAPEEVSSGPTYREIRYEERRLGEAAIGFLHFDFYNGAMSSEQCVRLLAAYERARNRPTLAIVLMGGEDFWSNGIHLNMIEAATSPADESWRNINAIDDLARAIIETDSHLTVAALQGNTGAGGCFLALAADLVWARAGVILNPHYKNMGNLYGSEYWTYLLPRRIGMERARAIMANRLPQAAPAAAAQGMIDAAFGNDVHGFRQEVGQRVASLAQAADFADRLVANRARRAADEAAKPLAAYRTEELEQMRRNFYGFDPSYHVARYHFVHKTLHSWTPRHLARHRDIGWDASLRDAA